MLFNSFLEDLVDVEIKEKWAQKKKKRKIENIFIIKESLTIIVICGFFSFYLKFQRNQAGN